MRAKRYMQLTTYGKDSEAGDTFWQILETETFDFGQIPDNCISRTAGGPESIRLHSVVFRMFADGFWQSGRPFQLVFEYAILQNSTSWTQDDQHTMYLHVNTTILFYNSYQSLSAQEIHIHYSITVPQLCIVMYYGTSAVVSTLEPLQLYLTQQTVTRTWQETMETWIWRFEIPKGSAFWWCNRGLNLKFEFIVPAIQWLCMTLIFIFNGVFSVTQNLCKYSIYLEDQ